MNLVKGGGVNLAKKNKNNEQDYTPEDYTKDNFIEDLKKVCRPVKKQDNKQKPSSGKT